MKIAAKRSLLEIEAEQQKYRLEDHSPQKPRKAMKFRLMTPTLGHEYAQEEQEQEQREPPVEELGTDPLPEPPTHVQRSEYEKSYAAGLFVVSVMYLPRMIWDLALVTVVGVH